MDTKKELIEFFESLPKEKKEELRYSPSLTKNDLNKIYEKVSNEEFITIRVLTQIYFVEDPSIYTEEKGKITYNVGDILTNVNAKYRERLEKHPTHIEILED